MNRKSKQSLDWPCTTQDKELFATAIKVTVGDGRCHMDIASFVYERSKRKMHRVQGFRGDFWISHFNNHNDLSLDHIVWEML
jgi:hypothetical protein